MIGSDRVCTYIHLEPRASKHQTSANAANPIVEYKTDLSNYSPKVLARLRNLDWFGYMNHSFRPNVVVDSKTGKISTDVTIKAGDELEIDYSVQYWLVALGWMKDVPFSQMSAKMDDALTVAFRSYVEKALKSDDLSTAEGRRKIQRDFVFVEDVAQSPEFENFRQYLLIGSRGHADDLPMKSYPVFTTYAGK